MDAKPAFGRTLALAIGMLLVGTAFGGVSPAAAMHEPLPFCSLHDLAAVRGDAPKTIKIELSLQDSKDGLPDPIDAINVSRDGSFLVQLNTTVDPATGLPADLEEGPAPVEFHWDDDILLDDGELHTYVLTPICGGVEGPAAGPVQAETPDVPDAPRDLSAEAGDLRTGVSIPETQEFVSSAIAEASSGSVLARIFGVAGEALECTADCIVLDSGVGVIDVDWTHPKDDGGFRLLGYIVYRGTDPGSLQPVAVTQQSFFRDDGLNPTQNYFYQVQAVNALGLGALSDKACSAPGPLQDPLESPVGTPCDPLI